MRAHIFRELVKDLRDIATQWHGSEQLRERISGRLRQDVSIDEDPANEGWIPWAGGRGPVGAKTGVQVKDRTGRTCLGAGWEFDWEHAASDYDIIAYRIVRK